MTAEVFIDRKNGISRKDKNIIRKLRIQEQKLLHLLTVAPERRIELIHKSFFPKFDDASDMIGVKMGHESHIDRIDIQIVHHSFDDLPATLISAIYEHIYPVVGNEGTVSLPHIKKVYAAFF